MVMAVVGREDNFVVGERTVARTRPEPPLLPAHVADRWLKLELSERALLGGPPIAVVDWPGEAARLEDLRCLGVPRLVAIRPEADAIVPGDDLEDWVRLPADERDVRARLGQLRDCARRRPASPVVDEAGRVIFGGRWVAVSVVEERLVRALVERFGEVIRHDHLLATAWPGRTDRAILRPVMCRLRRRVASLGLELLNIRDVGYLLHAQSPTGSATRD